MVYRWVDNSLMNKEDCQQDFNPSKEDCWQDFNRLKTVMISDAIR